MAGSHHLAQINVARMRAPLDDPLMAGFVALLDPINRLAEESPGFVWRLQSDAGNATDIQAFEDPRLLVNMAVWESLEALQQFVYRSRHRSLLRQRQEWFEVLERSPIALWWIPVGHTPDAAEGRARIETLWRCGPTREAFSFRSPFPPP
jgi:hypothetical protein